MCGITGSVWREPRYAVDEGTLSRMTDQLRHRGPDDLGLYQREIVTRPPYDSVPGVALGFRRLAIIDLVTGKQPLANEDNSIWVVFNGEIYNFEDLRRRLEAAGHTFRTHSDTETIVHLYEDEGVNCFQHLNGMFAIAIWDANKRRLVLGRDRLGEKPLFYHATADRLVFASELKSLLQAPAIPREIDPNAIDEYLTYQYVPHPNSIWKGIRKLPPGYRAVWQDGRVEVDAYWQPDFSQVGNWTEAAAIERARELIPQAIQSRMRSDVPLGAFLSGGTDSSLVVALMQQFSSRPVQTFTIGFPVKEYDETHYARLVAEHLGTDHHEFQVTPSAIEILPRLAWHYDEPFADSSAIPTWYVSQHTRNHVTVALTGDGGDELFAGYSRYRAVALGKSIDRWPLLRALIGAKVWQRIPGSARQKSLGRRLKRFSEAIRREPCARYLDWISIFTESRRAMLYREDFVAQLGESDPASFLERAWQRSGKRDPVTAASLADLVTYLPGDLMTKVDIASMAHSLECRQPLLDHHVVEFAASLPVELKYRRGRGKWLLRAAFGDLLPSEIWTRRKMGFGVPLGYWFRHELRSIMLDTLTGPHVRSHQYLRSESIQRLIDEHLSAAYDHSHRLWALMMLELWLQKWA
ncbi:MAG: asparagine synthase (glutamine-hydrolyzing) [Planctomycetota bacterium]